MKHPQIAFLFIFLSISAFSQNQKVKHEARRAVEIFFEGFHRGDTLRMRSALANHAQLFSATTGQNGKNLLSETSINALLKAIANRPSTDIWEEKLTDTLLQTDGNLAMVWTPYQFIRNGKFSHCGANLFTVVKLDSGWKIISITDSRRQEDCISEKE